MVNFAVFSGYIILRSFEKFNAQDIWLPQVVCWVFLVIEIILHLFVYPKKVS